MGVREAVVLLVVGIAAHVAAAPQDDITLTSNGNGYNGVTVAISDQLDENNCVQYINSIEAMVETASQLMFNATEAKVFFGDVVIVVPEQWYCQGIQIENTQLVLSWDSAHLRVGPSHYLFGDIPWTQQLGGCGEPGDYIYLPENFLVNNANVGSSGSILVHEWAKYRWGLFEEYGHAHDAIFPPAYRDENNIIMPTYCTDQPLEGDMFCPEGGTEAECQFTPGLTQNTTITSSILSIPFLDTVNSFCNASNHNAAAPTKHNLLCDQSSAKDVMARHADMNGNPVSLKNTNFTVVRAKLNWPRMVLLVEYSAIMGLNQGQMVRGRWEQLRDNVRQFIKVEAAADSYMGVVVFGSMLRNVSAILPLDEQNRGILANYIPENIPDPNQGQKDLFIAISRGAEMLGAAGGTMILLTENLEEYTSSQNLVNAAANNPVWPILYPSNTQVPVDVYQQLASISPDTAVLTIPNTLFSLSSTSYQSVDTSAELHYSLLTATASSATRVASGSCNTQDCTIPLEMKNSTVYIPQAYVKVFCSTIDVNYALITVTDPNGLNLNSIKQDTNFLFEVSSLQTGQYLVSVSHSTASVSVIAELWTTPAPLNMQVSVWSPKGLHNLAYSPGFAPRLLAKVTNTASWPVLFADVTAQVANKNINQENPVNITLNDSGFGSDVTGQDGVYSGYLVGFEPTMDVTVTLTVTDNNGAARMVNSTLRAAQTVPGNVVCCGSQLDVSTLQLEITGSFEFSSTTVSGRFTGVPAGTFPPGRVTDLRAYRNGYYVTLTFTAPGAQLDQGQAEWYAVNSLVDGENLLISNISGVPAGSSVEGQVMLQECDKVYTLTVVAYFNGVYGNTSNTVRETVPCGDPGPNLTSGAIAGIVIGCILAVILILLIIYLCLNRDHLDDLWVWQILTCQCCCSNSEDDDLYNPPSQARRSDVIRNNSSPSKPIRDLTDLYVRPNVGVKKDLHQGKAQDEDDGGFGERQRQQNIVQRRAPEDAESLVSSTSTLPINKVGLPVGGDNHAYDDGPSIIYRNAPPVPVPRYPRANTQV